MGIVKERLDKLKLKKEIKEKSGLHVFSYFNLPTESCFSSFWRVIF